MAFLLQLTGRPEKLTMMAKDTEELEKKVALLRSLCDRINPYAPLSPKVQKQLKSLGVTPEGDPFALTNQLLLLMEEALEELHRPWPHPPVDSLRPGPEETREA